MTSTFVQCGLDSSHEKIMLNVNLVVSGVSGDTVRVILPSERGLVVSGVISPLYNDLNNKYKAISSSVAVLGSGEVVDRSMLEFHDEISKREGVVRVDEVDILPLVAVTISLVPLKTIVPMIDLH